jgi:GNAT superfamily N-acetyltransferase
MNLRPAVPEDIPALNDLAWKAKAHWGYSADQLESWRQDLETEAEDLPMRPVFLAEKEGQPIGFVQIATDAQPWELWALWVHPAHMGQGLGKTLLQWAKRQAATAGQSELAIDSDPNAASFYQSQGAQLVGVVEAPIAESPMRVRPQFRLFTMSDRADR